MKPMMQQAFGRIAGHSKSARAAAGRLAVALLALVLPAREAQAQDPPPNSTNALVGTWRFEVPENSGGPGLPGFFGYVTCHESGGLVENDNGPAGPSVGIGAWTRVGPREFVAILHKQGWGAGKDENGEPVIRFTGMVEVRQRITLSEDGSQFTSNDELKVFDPEGRLVFNPPPAPSYGTRVVVAPPAVQPQMLAPVVSGSEVTLHFTGRPGLNHQLQRSVRVDGGWSKLADVVVSTDGVGRFTDPAPPQPTGLYRVESPAANVKGQ